MTLTIHYIYTGFQRKKIKKKENRLRRKQKCTNHPLKVVAFNDKKCF